MQVRTCSNISQAQNDACTARIESPQALTGVDSVTDHGSFGNAGHWHMPLNPYAAWQRADSTPAP